MGLFRREPTPEEKFDQCSLRSCEIERRPYAEFSKLLVPQAITLDCPQTQDSGGPLRLTADEIGLDPDLDKLRDLSTDSYHDDDDALKHLGAIAARDCCRTCEYFGKDKVEVSRIRVRKAAEADEIATNDLARAVHVQSMLSARATIEAMTTENSALRRILDGE